jgi:hypothetical protein
MIALFATVKENDKKKSIEGATINAAISQACVI